MTYALARPEATSIGETRVLQTTSKPRPAIRNTPSKSSILMLPVPPLGRCVFGDYQRYVLPMALSDAVTSVTTSL